MKFAHLADCHVGGWREPKMREANNQAFLKSINHCLKERVDFVLISGDLFNTAVPAIDSLKLVVKKLKELKDNQIPVYVVAGSHDYSASGKTMLDVLESAGLVTNVAKDEELPNNSVRLKLTTDQKTGAKITGFAGKKGGLEQNRLLQVEKEQAEKGYKIFMFHTTLAELKPQELDKVEAISATVLPEGFDYYAGGHVHIADKAVIGNRNIVYPGPTFPNNFAELEKLKKGSFVIVEDGKIEHVEIETFPVQSIVVEAEDKSPTEVEQELEKEIQKINAKDSIVTIRINGCLRTGKPSDIRFQELLTQLHEKGAYFIMKNTYALKTKELEEVSISSTNVEELEAELIKKHAGQKPLQNLEEDIQLTKKLMQTLMTEKAEGERVPDFETRIFQETDDALEAK